MLNSPSGQPHLPTKGGQSSLQNALGDGRLRSKKLVSDRPDNINQGCSAQNLTKIYGCRGGNGGGSAGAEGEGNPREAFGIFETANIETSRDNRSDIAVIKLDGNPVRFR